VRNAVRHTQRGTTVKITVGAKESGWCRLTVRDHGEGVPESQLSSIFEPFHRVDEGRRVADGGAGIGLAIAKKAVLLHGGTITAANTVGGGLTVTVCLPMHHAGNGKHHANEPRSYPS
jgi:two-component system sensor histidine kinase CpxA